MSRRCARSAPARSTSSSPPTSPPAASTSRTSPTSSTTSAPRTRRPTSTASAAPAAPGQTGIAVTFVDWDDLHRWTMINKALDLGIPDPEETYSSSDHFYEQMDIPLGSKGRLAKSEQTRAGPRRRDARGPRRDRQVRRAPSRPAGRGSRDGGSRDGGRGGATAAPVTAAPATAVADVAASARTATAAAHRRPPARAPSGDAPASQPQPSAHPWRQARRRDRLTRAAGIRPRLSTERGPGARELFSGAGPLSRLRREACRGRSGGGIVEVSMT